MLRKMLLLTVVACLAFAVQLTTASAAEKGLYFSLGAGFGIGEDAGFSAYGLEGNEIGDSAVFAAAFGYKLPMNFRTEIEIDYHPDFALDENYSTGGLEIEQKAEISSFSGFANLVYDIPTKSVTPFIGAGIGFARNEMKDITNTVTNGPLAGSAAIVNGATETSFAWQLMLGVLVPMNESLGLEVSYHYVDLGDIKTGTTTFQGVTAPPETGSLQSHDFRLAVTYHF